MSVSIKRAGKGIKADISHRLADVADPEVLEGCVEELLRCADDNGCLDGKVSLSNACLETLARHNEAVKCIASCFGCA